MIQAGTRRSGKSPTGVNARARRQSCPVCAPLLKVTGHPSAAVLDRRVNAGDLAVQQDQPRLHSPPLSQLWVLF
jgi:hypothetical protein